MSCLGHIMSWLGHAMICPVEDIPWTHHIGQDVICPVAAANRSPLNGYVLCLNGMSCAKAFSPRPSPFGSKAGPPWPALQGGSTQAP